MDNIKALHCKILLSHCFHTFFPFHKLQICLHIGNFDTMTSLGSKQTTSPPSPFVLGPFYHISLNFPNSCLLKPPTVYSGPKSNTPGSKFQILAPKFEKLTEP